MKDNFWEDVLLFGDKKRIFTPKERDFMTLAANIHKTGRIPSEKQASIILDIYKKIQMEGYVNEEGEKLNES